MKARRLDVLISPESLAVVVAGEVPEPVVQQLLANVTDSPFSAPKAIVRCTDPESSERSDVPEIADLPFAPDLAAVLATPAAMPGVLDALAGRGCRCVLALGQDGNHQDAETEGALAAAIARTGRYGRMRLLGPGSLGLMVPGIGLNAGLAVPGCSKGAAAFLTRSNGMLAVVLERAAALGIGFTVAVSLGQMRDVDFAEMLDHLALDGQTRMILLHIDEVPGARRFLSAVRKVARLKPVVVLRSPRFGDREASDRPAISEDAVFDEACRRVGLLQVTSVSELLSAVPILSGRNELYGDGLAICANDPALATLATARLRGAGGHIAAVDRSLGNPACVALDAHPAAYAQALTRLQAEAAVGAILLIHAPAVGIAVEEVAAEVVKASIGGKPVLAVWFAKAPAIAAAVRPGRARVSHYGNIEQALSAFTNLVRYRQTERTLLEMVSEPKDLPDQDRSGVRRLLNQAGMTGRKSLSEPEALQLLGAYGFRTTSARLVGSPAAAAEAAKMIGFPVDLYPVDDDGCGFAGGGAQFGLSDSAQVQSAAAWLETPPSASRPGPAALIKAAAAPAGSSSRFRLIAAIDPAFGPAIEIRRIERDETAAAAVALPPVTGTLARRSVDRLWPMPPASIAAAAEPRDALATMIAHIGQVIAENGAIESIDVWPIEIDAGGLLVGGAAVGLAPPADRPEARLALPSYPAHLESIRRLRDGSEVLIRPIRPEDESLMHAFFARLSAEDIRLRFFSAQKELDRRMAVRMTQIDYDREMSMVAVAVGAASPELLGVTSLNADAEFDEAEYAITVRTDLKGTGLGRVLMLEVLDFAMETGIREVWGEVRSDNAPMLGLLRKLGFAIRRDPDEPGVMRVVRRLAR